MAHTVVSKTERYSGSYEKETKNVERSTDSADALQDVESQKVAGSGSPVSFPEAASPEDENGAGPWGWLTVCGAFIMQFTGFGYSNAFGVYQDYYVRVFLTRNTASQISWIGSVETFLMLSLGLFIGHYFDQGYCYHLMVSGSIILIFSLFMLSLAKPDHYYQIFLAQGLGVGLGAALAYIPSLGVLAQHFPSPHKRAIAMCIAVSGASLGGLLHPIMLNNLFYSKIGFAGGVRASAGLVAGLQVVALAIIRTKYPKLEEGDAGGAKKSLHIIPAVKKFSKDSAYVCATIGFALYEMVFFFPCFYLQLDAIKHNLSADFAFYSLSILNGVSLIGRIVPGFYSKKIGVANMLILASVVCTVLMFSMLGIGSTGSVAVFGALYGFFSGAYISLMAPMLALLAENPTEIGARMGVAFTVGGFGSLIGTPIAGALLTTRYLWWRPIVFDGVVCAAGVVLFIVSRYILARRKNAGWVI